MPQRYLTKSRFKLARECPTKLYYGDTSRKNEYPNAKLDDPFLESLANGGFQVGELAKHYFPNGTDVTVLDHASALAITNELLAQENVVIYEAAIAFENLFVRVDVLVKKGNRIRLIEVKAKSCAGNNPQQFQNKSGYIDNKWLPYLEDIAFQKYVAQRAFKAYTITASLMLADKNQAATTDGLNSKFRVVRDQDRVKGVKVSNSLSAADLATPILTEIPVDIEIDRIFNGEASKEAPSVSFKQFIANVATSFDKDEKIAPRLTKVCKYCEFRCAIDPAEPNKKIGFNECWQAVSGLSDTQLAKPLIVDLWHPKTEAHLAQGLYKLEDLNEEDIRPKNPSNGNKPGLSRAERQWLQIEKVKNPKDAFYFDKAGLQAEIDTWVYPLHFIDFETSKAALPFNAGRTPYEQVAFQFSHHVVEKNGDVRHQGEFINVNPGEFPNYHFVRALKQELETDQGTVFRFHNHENTVLCDIHRQLRSDETPPDDADELCEFIQAITHSTKDAVAKWAGERDMVDLQRLVVQYFYDPQTNGSNSIKAVLPAIINRSTWLQEKYSAPIYGSERLPSINFPPQAWVKEQNGQFEDPYKLLPPLFEDIDTSQLDLLSNDVELRDGGAALTAYGMLQSTEMSASEREEMTAALLRYCELDTLAMVMIYEAWMDWLN